MSSLILKALQPIASFASGLGKQKKLFILIYHRVLDEPDFMRPGEVDKHAFTWQMQLLAKYFNVLPLAEALQGLQNGQLPSRAVSITFDDGYADNLHNAVPILKQFGLTATFFIASGFLNGGRMWNDSIIETIRVLPGTDLDLTAMGLGHYAIATPQEKAQTAATLLKKLKHLEPAQRQSQTDLISKLADKLPGNLMLTDAELKALHAQGMEIGGHTVNHPILAKLSDDMAWQEISANKLFLEHLLNVPIRYFAYPNGKLHEDYRPEQTGLVKNAGYLAALSTQTHAADPSSSIWQLPRFTPWDNSPAKFMLRLIKTYIK